MRLRPFEYVVCKTAREAARQLREHDEDSWLIAGGTVVIPMMKHRVIEPHFLVSLAEAVVLRGITLEETQLRIGALTSHRDIAMSRVVREYAPLLATACGRVASPVIRSMGTIGGNLAYAEPASDPPSALVALDAKVTLEGVEGSRVVAARDFFLDLYETVRLRTEVLTSITVPKQDRRAKFRYIKWTPRSREDKPLVSVAAVVRIEGDRCLAADIALGGASLTPMLLRSTASVLVEARLTEETISEAAQAAAQEIDPFDDLQGSAAFRRKMVRVWVRRALLDLAKSED